MEDIRTRIAIIDDDPSVRRALKRFLCASKFDAESYGSGPEFLEAFRNFRPQCVILDLHMEGMNGIAVQQRLQDISRDVPVIVVTGHDSLQARTSCLASGVSAFLAKPVDGKLLVATVQQLVGLPRSAPMA